mmetsp:Transcript_2801/g.3196  ORF Transcript_2801/g.3196 Transcript_2801/m.3196 type:complete len:338 (+) Transcript_2801:475-1488(+)
MAAPTLSTDDRLHLCSRIVRLNGVVLSEILGIIKDVEPSALMDINGRWSFDLAAMKDSTLVRIKSLLESKFGKRYMMRNPNPTLPNGFSAATLDAIMNTSFGMPTAQVYNPADPRMNLSKPFDQSTVPMSGNPMPTSFFPQSEINSRAGSSIKGNKATAVLPKKKHVAPKQKAKKRSVKELHEMGFQECFKIGKYQIYEGKDDTGTAKRLICGECGKIFRGRSEVVVHVRVHTGEKPLACKYCGRAFAHPSNLKVHERSHRGEQNYVCKFPGCGKRFAHNTSLRDHTYKHTGDYPHKCTYPGCRKGFRSKSYLSKHLQSHAKKEAKMAAKKAKKMNM